MLGLQFEISQPQASYRIHLLLPTLKQTLTEMGMMTERYPEAVADNPLVAEEHLALFQRTIYGLDPYP